MSNYFFNQDELDSMRSIQEGHMMDCCRFITRVVTANTWNEQVESFPADGIEISCGLDMKPGVEKRGVDNTILEYDATLRLPIDTVVDVKDKIKITRRYGETLSVPLIFEIVAPSQQGSSGIRLLLKRIEL